MGRNSSLMIKNFPERIKSPLIQIARNKSEESGRRITLTEIVKLACNAYVEQVRVDRPHLLRAAVFTRSADHDLILDSIQQGCTGVAEIAGYVNRARHEALSDDAIAFLIEDLVNARQVESIAQGKAGHEKLHGNAPKMIFRLRERR
jgi:hypothetical protein